MILTRYFSIRQEDDELMIAVAVPKWFIRICVLIALAAFCWQLGIASRVH